MRPSEPKNKCTGAVLVKLFVLGDQVRLSAQTMSRVSMYPGRSICFKIITVRHTNKITVLYFKKNVVKEAIYFIYITGGFLTIFTLISHIFSEVVLVNDGFSLVSLF